MLYIMLKKIPNKIRNTTKKWNKHEAMSFSEIGERSKKLRGKLRMKLEYKFLSIVRNGITKCENIELRRVYRYISFRFKIYYVFMARDISIWTDNIKNIAAIYIYIYIPSFLPRLFLPLLFFMSSDYTEYYKLPHKTQILYDIPYIFRLVASFHTKLVSL